MGSFAEGFEEAEDDDKALRKDLLTFELELLLISDVEESCCCCKKFRISNADLFFFNGK